MEPPTATPWRGARRSGDRRAFVRGGGLAGVAPLHRRRMRRTGAHRSRDRPQRPSRPGLRRDLGPGGWALRRAGARGAASDDCRDQRLQPAQRRHQAGGGSPEGVRTWSRSIRPGSDAHHRRDWDARRPCRSGLRERGCHVRVLSRKQRAGIQGVDYVVGDPATGTRVAEAVAGVEAIVHCASAKRGDVDATRNLIKAATAHRRPPDLVYISSWGWRGSHSATSRRNSWLSSWWLTRACHGPCSGPPSSTTLS